MKKLLFISLVLFIASCDSYTPTAEMGTNDAFVRAFVNNGSQSTALVTVKKVYDLTVDADAVKEGDSFYIYNAGALKTGTEKDLLLSYNSGSKRWRLVWNQE